MRLHFTESVRNAVCEIYCVVLLLKLVSKTHFVIFFLTIKTLKCFRKSTLLVPYTDAISMPILGVILGCNPHSMVVQTLLLGEVQNIEGGHSEVSLVLD